MKTWQVIIVSVCSALAVAGLILLLSRPVTSNYIVLPTRAAPQQALTYITGAIHNPGTYSLLPGSRVDDLIKAAGGFTTVADITSINLAAPIVDGEHIHVYALGEPKLSSQSSEETPEVVLYKDNPININTASISELDQLPGIGETRAQDIIIYRDIHGPFEKIEDLMNVPGIGESTFNNIKDYITIQTTTP
jgi:competence protein ComEA